MGSVGHVRTPCRTHRFRRPWVLGGLHIADKQVHKVMEEKNPWKSDTKAPMSLCCWWPEARGPPGQSHPAVPAPALLPAHLGDIQAGYHRAEAETSLWAALFCLSSLFAQSGFHAALCPTKPPSTLKANVIFLDFFFAPKRGQLLLPRNTCPIWLLGHSFSLHEQRTKK